MSYVLFEFCCRADMFRFYVLVFRKAGHPVILFQNVLIFSPLSFWMNFQILSGFINESLRAMGNSFENCHLLLLSYWNVRPSPYSWLIQTNKLPFYLKIFILCVHPDQNPVKARGQLCRVHFLQSPLCGFWGQDIVHRAWQQAFLPSEPSHQELVVF